jgi:5-oxoprolinase (ATP-hydrolysing)/N-methylhydantoinase A
MVLSSVRLAADIGGTFTDVVLDVEGRRYATKHLTTHDAPERAVLDAGGALLREVRLSFADVLVFVHGTTLATNAIIERKGARTALIATDGFRDVIEIADESRFDQYDLALEKTLPLVPRRLRFTVPERIDVNGCVLRPLDEDAVVQVAAELAECNVGAIAISLIHAYANAAHEERIAAILSSRLPGVALSLSSHVCPEAREYERTSTAIANAYVQPLMAGYLHRLQSRFRESGGSAPIQLMTSNGALASLDSAARFPIRLVESGPAGGALLAGRLAAERGLNRIVSFDMGGTTAKLCLIENAEPRKARTFEVDRRHRFMKGSGLPIRIPVIDMVEIGAGGGSIAYRDGMNRLRVGPESAGSEPGPAAYARGGVLPTVTDADVVLGRIDPARFAGGQLALDPALAMRAMSALDDDPHAAAEALAEIVDETMANAARQHAVERGEAIDARTMIAFGGAAPLHASRLAEKLGIQRIIVPPGAGVGSAIGFLDAPAAYELVRSMHMRLDRWRPADLDAVLDELIETASAHAAAAAGGRELSVTRHAYMRYAGQGHEIAVALPDRALNSADSAHLRDLFELEYRRLFERHIPSAAIEIMAVVVHVGTPRKSSARLDGVATRPAPQSASTRDVLDTGSGRRVVANVYLRDQLEPGMSISGPALIVEAGTTTYVSPVFAATVDAGFALVLQRNADSAPRRQTSDIEFQVMWDRLIAVVEEQAQTLLRTAFSAIVREAGDLSAGVFDPDGRMLAQAVTGTPGHVNSMAESVGHTLRHFGRDAMRAGDIYITNDPWQGTGHLNDFVVTTPCFRNGRLVALFSCTSHLMDIGGLGFGPDATDLFMEGLQIPHLRLAHEGRIDEVLIAMIRANTRLPVETVGDVYALAACNAIGCQRLVAMMDEFGLEDLDLLARHIISTSRNGVLNELAKVPHGRWSNSMVTDGYDTPITLAAATTISTQGVHVDYTGTSPAVGRGINVPLAYTTAYTVFGLASALAPRVPNNAGSLSVFKVTAPPGTIVNAIKPAPVAIRHIIGQMLPDVVFGCLASAVPDRIPAEGTSCLWNINVRGSNDSDEDFGFFMTITSNGGTGARPFANGLSATAYPSGVKGTPVEIAEALTPLIFWRKELRAGSGGVGRYSGGDGQVIEIASRIERPFELLAAFDRIDHPPRGRGGGAAGAAGQLLVRRDGVDRRLPGKGLARIAPGERLVILTPGGGGHGMATT